MIRDRIDAAWTVNEIVQRHPEAVSVLLSFGIDTCCGGALSLEEAARRHGVVPQTVLQAIEAAQRVECSCRFTTGGT